MCTCDKVTTYYREGRVYSSECNCIDKTQYFDASKHIECLGKTIGFAISIAKENGLIFVKFNGKFYPVE